MNKTMKESKVEYCTVFRAVTQGPIG